MVADYEWDAFGLPDLRSDWQVLRLKVEHTQPRGAQGGPEDVLACPPGAVLRSFEIDQMNRWDDDRDPAIQAWYVLDLLPIQSP